MKHSTIDGLLTNYTILLCFFLGGEVWEWRSGSEEIMSRQSWLVTGLHTCHHHRRLPQRAACPVRRDRSHHHRPSLRFCNWKDLKRVMVFRTRSRSYQTFLLWQRWPAQASLLTQTGDRLVLKFSPERFLETGFVGGFSQVLALFCLLGCCCCCYAFQCRMDPVQGWHGTNKMCKNDTHKYEKRRMNHVWLKMTKGPIACCYC